MRAQTAPWSGNGPDNLSCFDVQVLAELIISNESRIIESDSVSFYNRMRSFNFTATIRYQVSHRPLLLQQSKLCRADALQASQMVAELELACLRHQWRILRARDLLVFFTMASYKALEMQLSAQLCMQDFDKLDGILKEYKRFMSESPYIDKTLPSHVHLAGFATDGLQVHVHVSPSPCFLLSESDCCYFHRLG